MIEGKDSVVRNIVGKRPPPFSFCPHPFYRSTLFSENTSTPFSKSLTVPSKKRGLPTVTNWNTQLAYVQYQIKIQHTFKTDNSTKILHNEEFRMKSIKNSRYGGFSIPGGSNLGALSFLYSWGFSQAWHV